MVDRRLAPGLRTAVASSAARPVQRVTPPLAALRIVVLLIVVLLIVVLLISNGWTGGGGQLAIGETAPNLDLTLLDGSSFEPDQGPLLVNFWATWCGACKAAVPELRAIADQDEVDVLGLALDGDVGAVEGFAARHRLSYAQALDENHLFDRFGGLTIPYSVLLDGNGEVVGIYRGNSLHRSDVSEALAKGGSIALAEALPEEVPFP